MAKPVKKINIGMISFKQYITEVGDTEAGRQTLARYVGLGAKQLAKSVERNDARLKHLDSLSKSGDERRVASLISILKPDIQKSQRRAESVQKAFRVIMSHPNNRRYVEIARNIAIPGIKNDRED
jgi:hypothetical protein